MSRCCGGPGTKALLAPSGATDGQREAADALRRSAARRDPAGSARPARGARCGSPGPGRARRRRAHPADFRHHGTPKLVPATHRQLVARAEQAAETLGIGPGDRCLCPMPLCYGHGIYSGLLFSLLTGRQRDPPRARRRGQLHRGSWRRSRPPGTRPARPITRRSGAGCAAAACRARRHRPALRPLCQCLAPHRDPRGARGADRRARGRDLRHERDRRDRQSETPDAAAQDERHEALRTASRSRFSARTGAALGPLKAGCDRRSRAERLLGLRGRRRAQPAGVQG